VLYHYTFCLYRRSALLVDPEIVSFLKAAFLSIAAEKEFRIIECEILCDHVHLLIDQSYNQSESFVMKSLKGVSARMLFKNFDANRFEVRKLWARSFFVRKISNAQKEAVVNYIRLQKTSEDLDKRF